MFTPGDIFRSIAGVDELIESISNAAILQSWTAVHADVKVVTIGRAAEKLNRGVQEGTIPHFWAAKTEKSLRVAVRHLVRPIASIRLRIEGQTLWTVEHVTPTVHAVHELTAVLMIANLEVAVLMGTVVGRTCRLQIWPACAIYVDRISAGIIKARFRIEIQAFGT